MLNNKFKNLFQRRKSWLKKSKLLKEKIGKRKAFPCG